MQPISERALSLKSATVHGTQTKNQNVNMCYYFIELWKQLFIYKNNEIVFHMYINGHKLAIDWYNK